MPFTNPWSLLLAGLGAVVLALLLQSWAPLSVLLVVTAILLALGGIGIRLRLSSEDVEERFKTAGAIALAAFIALLGSFAMDKDWDTATLLLGVFVGVGIAAALLVLLPRLLRRLTLSVLVVIHFGGMVTSFASVPPPGGQSSAWMANMAWTLFYRPYLHFIYMTNAYHFYSPEPGAPSLLWFYIEYEGGKTRWVEIPNNQESPTRMALQRRLALTESTNQLNTGPFPYYQERLIRRNAAGLTFSPPLPDLRNPIYSGNEYREPTLWARHHIASYARYVAKHFPCEENPSLPVKSVKVYRYLHGMLPPNRLAAGADPYDPTMYLPYYQGEFDKDGNHLDGPKYDKDDNMIDPGSPFLYWLIPIDREPVPGNPKQTQVVDYVKIHARGSKR
jgi:hypothetical protein